jgi:hypothetical protein
VATMYHAGYIIAPLLILMKIKLWVLLVEIITHCFRSLDRGLRMGTTATSSTELLTVLELALLQNLIPLMIIKILMSPSVALEGWFPCHLFRIKGSGSLLHVSEDSTQPSMWLQRYYAYGLLCGLIEFHVNCALWLNC